MYDPRVRITTKEHVMYIYTYVCILHYTEMGLGLYSKVHLTIVIARLVMNLCYFMLFELI